MKRVSTFLIAFIFAALSACASTSVTDKYYSLVLAADDAAAPAMITTAQARVIVGPVVLPSYLNQRGLSIQTGHNQIQSANHHFWAEPLDVAIGKVLVRDLSRASSGITAERDVGRWTGAAKCRLRFEFDKFHATSDSSVVMSGRYWFSSDAATVSVEFNQTRVLTADGYAHAVAALREILLALARDVSETLQEGDRCS